MWNRISKTLSPAELTDLADAINTLKTTLGFAKTLVEGERKSKGWYDSENAKLMMADALRYAKSMPPNTFTNLNAADFEQDLILLKELEKLDYQLVSLRLSITDTKRVLKKDLSEQSLYVYRMLKIMHDVGIAGGTAAYQQLSSYMPGKGKRKPKDNKKDEQA